MGNENTLIHVLVAVDRKEYQVNIFFISHTHWKHLINVLLMNTHKVCFHGEFIKNINTFWLKKVPYLKP